MLGLLLLLRGADRRVGSYLGFGGNGVENVRVVARFLRRDPHIVGPGLQRLVDPLVPRSALRARMQHGAVPVLQVQVGVGILLAEVELYRLRLAQREAVIVHRVRAAVERAPVPCPVQPREVAQVDRAGGRRVGIRGRRRRLRLLPVGAGDCRVRVHPLRHPHRVGAGVLALAARGDVVGAALARGEGQTGVVALAAVLSPGIVDALAGAVEEPVQHRVAQRAPAAVVPLDVDDIGPARHQLDGEPVDVPPGLDLAGGRAAHRDGAVCPDIR